jgi:hypothetical protein
MGLHEPLKRQDFQTREGTYNTHQFTGLIAITAIAIKTISLS